MSKNKTKRKKKKLHLSNSFFWGAHGSGNVSTHKNSIREIHFMVDYASRLSIKRKIA